MIPRLRKQEGSCLVVVLLIIVVILGIALLASYDESQETTDVEAVDVSALKTVSQFDFRRSRSLS